MATELTLEQYKAWVEETFPNNTSRSIDETNFRDGFNKMAEFVTQKVDESASKLIINNDTEF